MKEKDLMEKIIKQGKLVILLLFAILIVLIIGVSKMYSNSNGSTTNTSSSETEETEYNTNYDVSMFNEITANDINKKTKGELSVIYVGRESCGWCAAFLPNLWAAQEDYKFTTLYIDIAKIINFSDGSILDQKAFNTLNNLTGEDYEGYMKENLGATPMILIVKDNKIISAQTGYTEYSDFETFLNNAGIK